MIAPWKAYKRWEEKRLVRYDPRRWERTRARGEAHFIWRVCLFYGGGMVLLLQVSDLLRGKFSLLNLVIHLILFAWIGRSTAIRLWLDGEARYRAYRLQHPGVPSPADGREPDQQT